jgi:hypothetical protein
MLNLYLPGFSAGNEEFLAKYTKKLRKLGYQVYGRRWDHWGAAEDTEFDAAAEAEKIWPVLRGFKQNMGVVAKSIGTLVAAKLIVQHKIDPQYLVLMGIPLKSDDQEQIAELIAAFKGLTCPITVINNAGDPVAGLATVEVIAKAIGAKLDVQPRDDHKYDYLDELLALIKPYNESDGKEDN